jgi:chemotaxis regulatin CheY-phosphate phosphatase CheZ
MYTSVSDLRTVFNTIVEIIYQNHGRGSDNYPEGLGMKKRQQGAFAAQLKEQIEELSIDVDIKSARPYIDGERTRVWFGIELTDRAQKLLQMADKIGEEN